MAIYKCSYSDDRKPEFWTEIEAETLQAAALKFVGDWDGEHIDGQDETVHIHHCEKTYRIMLTVGWVVDKVIPWSKSS